MTDWTTQPILDSYVAVLLIAAALALLLLLGPAFHPITVRRRGVLIVLRLAVIVVVTALMLRPTCTSKVMKPQSATLLLLLDQSRSMQLPHASGGKSRWDAQRETLEQAAAALDQLARDVEVKIYAYDSQLHPLEIQNGKIALPAAAEGQQTDIGSPLDEAVRRERGKRLAGVVLLGDGAQTAFDPRVEMQEAVRELASLAVPLYTVPYGPAGEAAQARDVAIENMPDQYTVFVKNELPVRGGLRVRGYVNKDIPVELVVEDHAGKSHVIGPMQLQAREDGQQVDVEFSYVPQEAGQYRLTLRAAEQPGELVTKNNQLSAFLTVLEGGLKVLYLEGELRLEQKFLRRSIDASQDIELDFQWIDSRLRKNNWPVDLTETFKDPQYDVFIIGDLDATALYEKDKHEQTMQALVEAVDKGKGLIVLGGYHSFGPGGYRNTPLADVLPIVMGQFERADIDKPIVAASRGLHLEGSVQMLPASPDYLTRLAAGDDNLATWRTLPPLTGANKFTELKPRARVLAQTPDGTPLLVAGEYGGGRVLAFAGDSTWRWWMQGHDDQHKRFWRQVILWLARRDDLTQDNVWLRLPQRRFNLGGKVPFTAGAKTAAGDVIRGATFDATITLPDGKRQPQRLSLDGDTMTGTFDETAQPGTYTIEVTASSAGKLLGTAQAKFMVFDHDVELSNPAADPDQLARLADLTKEAGGKLIAPEQLAALLSQIKPPEMEIEVQTRWQLADNNRDAWLFFLCVVVLLTGEWVLRKKWGLV
jgi:uncharacterized membrane protein